MNWKGWGVGLALGAAGGSVFSWLDLPLPWMLGSMAACTAAALSGWRPSMPVRLRAGMMAILGVMLGASFTPDLAGKLAGWTGSLVGLFVVMAATTALVMAYLRRAGTMDAVTAYFAAAPGGLNEMIATGAAMGGDERAIALIHALRILLIVFAVPFGFRLITGMESQSMDLAMGALADLAVKDAAILAACAVFGAAAARLARLPAAVLVGPMLASAAVHLAGLTASHPPAELVIIAQIVTGAGIGSRFVGLTWRAVAKPARVALGSTAIMLVLSAGGALTLAAATDLPFALLLLAFVPGGIVEMCLIALALGQDVAFVSAHHAIRVAMVVVAAPLAFRLARPYWA